jgi:hypothetical protein
MDRLNETVLELVRRAGNPDISEETRKLLLDAAVHLALTKRPGYQAPNTRYVVVDRKTAENADFVETAKRADVEFASLNEAE